MFGFHSTQADQARLWREMHPHEAAESDRKRQEAFASAMHMQQLEAATGRNRLDIAVNGFPDSPLSPSKQA